MDKTIKFIYRSQWLTKILKSLLFSKFVGWLAKRKFSKYFINSFIRRYKIEMSDYEKDFNSFNDFFLRRLKKGARTICNEGIISPADGSITIYPKIEEFICKGQNFSLTTFLQDEKLAQEYQMGSMCIIRLSLYNYHRFHFPFDSKVFSFHYINGALYSVHPEALKKRPTIFYENRRVLVKLDHEVLFVAIGATAVGSIKFSCQPGEKYFRGDEMGYFELGGSSIALIFKKVTFNKELILGAENKIYFGKQIGQFL